VADEPVSINQLKRFAADWEMTSINAFPLYARRIRASGWRLSVAGAGLSCAYFLRRADTGGYLAMPKLGGMLNTEFRNTGFPKVLDWEIDGISLGVESHTNVSG
jgi:NADPH-dependent glutamate synthase beta subunit-like oxidoreductase